MLIPDEFEIPPPRPLSAALEVADTSTWDLKTAALATVAIPAAVIGRTLLDEGTLEFGPALIAGLAASAVALIYTLIAAFRLRRDLSIVRLGILVKGEILAMQATPAGGPYHNVAVQIRYQTRERQTFTGVANVKTVGDGRVFKPGQKIALLYLPSDPGRFVAHWTAYPLMHGRAQ